MYCTYNSIAVRLDVVDPESIISQGPCSAQQLLELTDGKWSHQTSNMDYIAGRTSSWRWRSLTNVDWIFSNDGHCPHWF